MAILVNKELNIFGGIPIDQIYIRLDYYVNLTGKSIRAQLYPYANKESFSSDWQENILTMEDFKTKYYLSYDSSLNGDPLIYIHNYIKEELSTDKTKIEQVLDPSTGFPVFIQEPVLDPSTGEQMTDPSTGELLWENGDPSTMVVIITPKFAMDSSISLVDLD